MCESIDSSRPGVRYSVKVSAFVTLLPRFSWSYFFRSAGGPIIWRSFSTERFGTLEVELSGYLFFRPVRNERKKLFNLVLGWCSRTSSFRRSCCARSRAKKLLEERWLINLIANDCSTYERAITITLIEWLFTSWHIWRSISLLFSKLFCCLSRLNKSKQL